VEGRELLLVRLLQEFGQFVRGPARGVALRRVTADGSKDGLASASDMQSLFKHTLNELRPRPSYAQYNRIGLSISSAFCSAALGAILGM
jgi:hypothetical protein